MSLNSINALVGCMRDCGVQRLHGPCSVPSSLQPIPDTTDGLNQVGSIRAEQHLPNSVEGSRSVGCDRSTHATSVASENQHEFIRLRKASQQSCKMRLARSGLAGASQMPLQFITYHRASASYTASALPDVNGVLYSHHQPDHVAVQQQHRIPPPPIVQSRLSSTATSLSSTPLLKAGLWIV